MENNRKNNLSVYNIANAYLRIVKMQAEQTLDEKFNGQMPETHILHITFNEKNQKIANQFLLRYYRFLPKVLEFYKKENENALGESQQVLYNRLIAYAIYSVENFMHYCTVENLLVNKNKYPKRVGYRKANNLDNGYYL